MRLKKTLLSFLLLSTVGIDGNLGVPEHIGVGQSGFLQW